MKRSRWSWPGIIQKDPWNGPGGHDRVLSKRPPETVQVVMTGYYPLKDPWNGPGGHDRVLSKRPPETVQVVMTGYYPLKDPWNGPGGHDRVLSKRTPETVQVVMTGYYPLKDPCNGPGGHDRVLSRLKGPQKAPWNGPGGHDRVLSILKTQHQSPYKGVWSTFKVFDRRFAQTAMLSSGWQWGPCALRHGIQTAMDGILACHPALSTKWLDWVATWWWCERWRMCTAPIGMFAETGIFIIGSAEALPILCVRYFRWEREREIQTDRDIERDGSDVTIVALKLAMNLHFPLPKIRTIGDELTLSLAKNSHFSFLLHTSRLSLRGEVTMVALKFAMSSHFPLPKIFSPSGFVPPLSNGTSRATSDRKPKTKDQILPSPIFLPIEKMNQINTKKTIGNRKRDCAWGGWGW